MRTLLGIALFGLSACGMPTAGDESATSGHAIEAAEPSVCTEATTCSSIEVRADERARACRVLVVFDGSGVYSPDVNSNVARIYKEALGPDTARVYVEGVPVFPLYQSAERVDRGRDAICAHLAAHASEDCDVVMLGYSRGAFIANQVAHALNEFGCADGSHVGQRIAFLGAFDPVNTQMGFEWKDRRTQSTRMWFGDVPSNVENVLQVYKDPKEDPRGGALAATLTTSLMFTGGITSSCNAPMTTANHPEHKAWHHGEVGHFDLSRNTMLCGLERAGIRL